MFSLAISALFAATVAFGKSIVHQSEPALLEKAKTIKNPHGIAHESKLKSNNCSFAYYSQCDSEWADIPLGTSTTNTICSAGCAMSSTAMMLSHYGTTMNPEQLNTWLIDNDGYEDGDLLVWGSVDTFGPSFQGIETGVSVEELSNGIAQCHGIIANVRDDTHWVLLTGYAGDDTFYVNDPGFDDSTYAYSDMSQWAVYH